VRSPQSTPPARRPHRSRSPRGLAVRSGAGSRRPRSRERGQASVELVALLPLVGLLVALLWQALLAGETVWLSGAAARAAARAAAVGGDPVAAARVVVPARLARGLSVERERDGGVTLVLHVPAALGGGSVAAVTARARFEAQR
jgi:hypothetical protein